MQNRVSRIGASFLILYGMFPFQHLFGQSTFEVRYGSDFEDYANKAIQTQDGKIVVGGTTWGFGSSSNAFLMKLDASGAPMWTRSYTGINADEVFDIIEQSDGGLVACGATDSYGVGYQDGFVMRTDSTGNMVWGRTYGNEFPDFLLKIVEDGAGGYFTAGYTQPPPLNPFQEGTLLLRLDPLGRVLWSIWLPGAWDAQNLGWNPIDMVTTTTGDVLLTTVHGGWTIDLWKFTATGQLLWSKTFDQESKGHRMAVDADGNVYITCFRPLEDGNFSIEVSVLKLDSNGNELWCKSYGGTYIEFARAITAPNEGGIAIAGYTNSSGHGGYDAFILRLDQDGSLLWGSTFGTVWDDLPNSLEPKADGGYIMAGQSYAYGSDPDSLKIYVVSTDGNGNADCSLPWSPLVRDDSVQVGSPIILPDTYVLQVDTLTWPAVPTGFSATSICLDVYAPGLQPHTQISAYPNPFRDRVVVTVQGSAEPPLRLLLRDLLGRVVYQVDGPLAYQDRTMEIDLGLLQRGTYILELLFGDAHSAVKLIKQ